MRARVVPAERVLEFRSSSLRRFVEKERPRALEAATVLAESGGLPDTPAGWRRYVEYLGVLAEEETKLRQERFGRLSRGWVIGSAEFKAELKQALAEDGAVRERFALLGADAGAHRAVRAELWEEKLGVAARALGLPLDALPTPKSAPEKVRLAALMKTATSVSNAWLAERLKMGEPASVSQYVRRFRLGGGLEKRAFKQALSAIKP